MQFSVKLSGAPFSSRKGKLVVDLVRGKNVNQALEILQFTHRRPAQYLTKLIRSCIANVEYFNAQDANKALPNVDSDELFIAEVRADEGPLKGYRRRWRPRSRGMATPVNKRTCHLSLILAEAESKEADAKEEIKAAKPETEVVAETTEVTEEANAEAVEEKAPEVKPQESSEATGETSTKDEE